MQDNFYKLQKGGAQPHVYGKDFGEFQIPLPPLSVQEEIVAEINGYQKEIEDLKLKVEEKEKWYFSIIDVVAILTEQENIQGAEN